MIDASHVRRVADECVTFLSGTLDTDWTVPIPDLEMSVVEVVAHAATGCLWYAIDLSADGTNLEAVEHRVKTDNPADVLNTLATYASVAAAVVETAPDGARGFHPMGSADPSGFAAMACDELLVHTDDAARGLGVVFVPSPDSVELVLRRLFPWIAPGEDPWHQLLWANGRMVLGALPRLDGWAWHCSPLDDWDGTIPTAKPR